MDVLIMLATSIAYVYSVSLTLVSLGNRTAGRRGWQNTCARQT